MYPFKNKTILVVLLILNGIVLLGQLWPEGAPPFAHMVNVVTLFLNILVIGLLFFAPKSK